MSAEGMGRTLLDDGASSVFLRSGAACSPQLVPALPGGQHSLSPSLGQLLLVRPLRWCLPRLHPLGPAPFRGLPSEEHGLQLPVNGAPSTSEGAFPGRPTTEPFAVLSVP